MSLSIVVPLAPGDRLRASLLGSIGGFSQFKCQKLLATTSNADAQDRDYYSVLQSQGWELLEGEQGRAKQLNLGLEHARGDYIWIVHADSELPHDVEATLWGASLVKHDTLFYFDLKFDRSFTSLMSVNELGVFIRSRLLKIPFGDQGFFFRKSVLEELEKFDEDAPYGEDHLFVWACHHKRIPVVSLKRAMTTSSRKYKKNGWLNTTVKHLNLTYQQAKPELVQLIKNEWKQRL